MSSVPQFKYEFEYVSVRENTFPHVLENKILMAFYVPSTRGSRFLVLKMIYVIYLTHI